MVEARKPGSRSGVSLGDGPRMPQPEKSQSATTQARHVATKRWRMRRCYNICGRGPVLTTDGRPITMSLVVGIPGGLE